LSRVSPQPFPNPAQILGANLDRVRARIRSAVAVSGRDEAAVRLLAVTKSVDAATTLELARLGVFDLGENRVERLADKATKLREWRAAAEPPVRWHMIGHLQRNKARRALEHAHAVHSIDTDRLLAALERLCGELGRELDAYLEVEWTELPTRSGFRPDEVRQLLEAGPALQRVKLRGLMTMAAPDENSREGDLASQTGPRKTFAALRRLAEQLPAERFEQRRIELCMGMSSDLEAAVAEGADIVRIGTALFEGLGATGAAESAT